MKTIRSELKLVRSDCLERRKNCWKRLTALTQDQTLGELNRRFECREINGRMDAYQNIAEFIDQMLNELDEEETEHKYDNCDE